MFHACGISDQTGRVAALIGGPGSGKSTSAIALGRAGLGYVSDEVVAVDEDLAVMPFPRPIAVGQANSGAKTQRSPDDLGLARCSHHLQVRRLVLLARASWHDGPAVLERVPLAPALAELAPHISALHKLERPLERLGRLIDACGGVYRLRYREIDQTSELLRSLLSSEVIEPSSWSIAQANAEAADTSRPTSRARGIVRAEAIDAVSAGDELVVLSEAGMIRLGGIGRTIWESTNRPVSVEGLVQAVEKLHGDHPDSRLLVIRAMERLREIGLLIGEW
jgi:hypothetical protein